MPTVVNTYRTQSSFAGSGTYTITGVTSGNTLVVIFEIASGNTPIISVTDNQSNTYTEDLTATGALGNSNYFYRASNITNAPTSVTIDWTGNALVTANIFEVSGLANTSPVDATVADTSNFSSTTTPSKSITTTTDNAAVFAWLTLANGATLTPDAGWSALPSSGSDFDFILYDNDVGAAGSKTVGGTLGSSLAGRWTIVAYKAASTATAVKPAMHYARLRTA
jgi:hypothetical protein